MTVKPNQIYTAHDFLRFQVTRTWLEDQDPWVEYTNTQTQQVYTCRQEAFLARFSLQVN